MRNVEPVRLRIIPIYGNLVNDECDDDDLGSNCLWSGGREIIGSIAKCGACDAEVPKEADHCPSCGVPILGRAPEQ